MSVNGMGPRAIERVKGVHHTTVITWVKQVGELLPDAYDPDHIPDVMASSLVVQHGARERAPRHGGISLGKSSQLQSFFCQ